MYVHGDFIDDTLSEKIVTRGRDVVLPLDGIEPSLARKSASAN